MSVGCGWLQDGVFGEDLRNLARGRAMVTHQSSRADAHDVVNIGERHTVAGGVTHCGVEWDGSIWTTGVTDFTQVYALWAAVPAPTCGRKWKTLSEHESE
jgi:hypothetical protein